MKRRLLTFVLILLVALTLPSSVLAQDYSFGLSKEVVNVYWNSDGTMALDYQFTFTNQPGAHVIDFVDVGMPNSSYDGSTIQADVNGNPVSTSSSDYQGSGSGFAVDLGNYAIQPGGSGTVHVFVGRIHNVLYPDDKDSNYASAAFSPTYFGSQYVVGGTDLTVTFHLPPGVKPEEPRYHVQSSGPGAQTPQASLDTDGRVTYTWSDSNANGYSSYMFGASFPKSYVPADAIQTPPPFDFSGLISSMFNILCCGFFALMFFGAPVLSVIQGQRRKLQYMPPRVAIEGHGIKRGLTAVESAILMEQPLDKVMTMILFGVVKKGAATVISRDPLKIQATDPLPDGLHDYEVKFLQAFKNEDARTRQNELQSTMVALVKSVTEKMRGFSRKETVDYYKSIMERAWQEIEAAGTPEVKSQKFDETMEWTMLDKDYDGRMRRTLTGPVFLPMWWGRYDPTFSSRPASIGASQPSMQRSGASSLPGADFAASVVTGVQGFSSKVIGNLNTFTSKVTSTTNPPPKPSVGGSYRGGGGGHSCACACACAGCACACAGGGR